MASELRCAQELALGPSPSLPLQVASRQALISRLLERWMCHDLGVRELDVGPTRTTVRPMLPVDVAAAADAVRRGDAPGIVDGRHPAVPFCGSGSRSRLMARRRARISSLGRSADQPVTFRGSNNTHIATQPGELRHRRARVARHRDRPPGRLPLLGADHRRDRRRTGAGGPARRRPATGCPGRLDRAQGRQPSAGRTTVERRRPSRHLSIIRGWIEPAPGRP